MKVISLLQPWATLVILGVKQIETRSWSTAYRGELLIHASKGKKGGGLVSQPPFSKHIQDFNQLPFGAIIGQVLLTEVLRVEDLQYTPTCINTLSLEERAFGDYSKGRFAWMMENPIPLKNIIPIGGSLGLWEYSGDLDL
ncbi:MAG TPA: ASCH domain-containing protein [Flavisolibacter sp.]|nr:ASCH domain-containing protein [Flavisolibacter sp.]